MGVYYFAKPLAYMTLAGLPSGSFPIVGILVGADRGDLAPVNQSEMFLQILFTVGGILFTSVTGLLPTKNISNKTVFFECFAILYCFLRRCFLRRCFLRRCFLRRCFLRRCF